MSESKIVFLKPEFEHHDDRGGIAQLVSSGWNQVNVITSDVGAIRGNHFHKNNKEAFFIIEGGFELVLELDGDEEKFTIKKGDFFVLKPNVNHIFKFTEPTVLVSMYDNGVEEGDGKMDIYSREGK